MYCISHKSQQIQILDPNTLALNPNGLVSLSQEMIEYAYNSMTQVQELDRVIQLFVNETDLWLITANGFFLLL